MIKLPDPSKYDDPIRFFRDSHGVIVSVLDRFERLVSQAKERGVAFMFGSTNEWAELLNFFVHTAPSHEMDEENALFPVVLKKIPSLGFQTPSSAKHFIHEQHEVMQERSKALLSLWRGFQLQEKLTEEDGARFIDVGEALIKLYREHVTRENELIYSVANDSLLSPVERIAIMAAIQEQHSNRSMTPFLEFEPSGITTGGDTSEAADAVSDDEIEIEESEEEEEE